MVITFVSQRIAVKLFHPTQQMHLLMIQKDILLWEKLRFTLVLLDMSIIPILGLKVKKIVF